MGKRMKGVTFTRQKRWYDEHKKYVGSEYKPFWFVEDIQSSGIKVKVAHFKHIYRVVHLLSINELFMYLLLAWDQDVVELYEQWALPLDVTVNIAKDENIEHPIYRDTGVPMIQTIDFYCIRSDGEKCAYAVKEKSALDKKRENEKLKIQEEYCLKNGIYFEKVTSDELKTVKCKNLERLYRHSKLDPWLVDVFKIWLSNFVGELSENQFDRVAHTLHTSSMQTGIPYQTAASFFYFAIWKGLLDFDWNLPLVLEMAASDLKLFPNYEYFSF